jgi:NADH-quinone oxidoreductase subunit L
MNWPFGEGAFSHSFGHWIGYPLEHSTGHEPHSLPFNWSVAGISTGLALLAIGLSWWLYGRNPRKTVKEPDPLAVTGPLFSLLANKYNVDEVYQFLIIDRFKDLAHFLAQTLDWNFWHDWFHDTIFGKGFKRLTAFLADPVDKGVIDGAALAMARAIQGGASLLSVLQTGFVRNYALSVFLGVVIILGYLVFN